jgi:hypothetical protein
MTRGKSDFVVASSALRLGYQIGVDHKRDIVGYVGRGWFDIGRKAVALLESLHLKGIDAVEDAVELIAQQRIGLDVQAAGQHHVHGAVEIRLGLDQLAFAVMRLAAENARSTCAINCCTRRCSGLPRPGRGHRRLRRRI